LVGGPPLVPKLPGIASSVLIVNPWASRVTPEVVAAVERELEAAGPLETVLTRRAGHATELATEAAGRSERIYVLSGDGGFNEVVNGVLGDEVAVGFIPGGGTSVLSRALGLPRDPVAAAGVLARSDAERLVSLGRVEGQVDGATVVDRRFAFAAGLGVDAALVRAVDARGRRGGKRPGDLAFAAEALRLLTSRRGRLSPQLTVVGRGRAAFALVANTDPYTYAGRIPLHAAPRASFEGGLDLAAPVAVGPVRLPVALAAFVGPRRIHPRWILRAHDQDELRIEADAPTPLQADGEDLGDVTAATFTAERGALRALVAR
jgi:diacylglycerol kinase family enzyme